MYDLGSFKKKNKTGLILYVFVLTKYIINIFYHFLDQ